LPSTLRLVAQTRQGLLDAARPYAPARVAAEEAEMDRLRQVTTDLKDVDRLAHRAAHLRARVAWADGLQQDLGPRPASPNKVHTRFEAALALAPHVLADLDDPAKGDQVRSVVDPEARSGKPGTYCDGYLLDLSLDADRARLTARHILPGNSDEARDTQPLLEAAERAQGHAVEAVSIDGLGWNGEVLRALRAPAGRGVEVYVPPPVLAATPVCGPEALILDAAQGVVTCPGGPQTATKERRADHTGWQFVLARRQWAGCRQPARCLATLPQKKGRRVIQHAYQAEYDAARAWAMTSREAAVRQQHPRVARQLADRVRDHDGHRSRYRGQWRVQEPYLLTGLVVHVQRRVKRLRPPGAQLVPPLV